MPASVALTMKGEVETSTWRSGSPTLGESNETPSFLRLDVNSGRRTVSNSLQISRTAAL
jgi:hypothetical protein